MGLEGWTTKGPPVQGGKNTDTQTRPLFKSGWSRRRQGRFGTLEVAENTGLGLGT